MKIIIHYCQNNISLIYLYRIIIKGHNLIINIFINIFKYNNCSKINKLIKIKFLFNQFMS